MSLDPFHPHPIDQANALEWLGPHCMDLGCGPNPLPGAEWLFDVRDWDNPNIIKTNFYDNPILPGNNVYCRHVLEDLRYPEALFTTFKHCEKGWIETPHPVVEITIGVDCMRPWRGFSHHYWFIWVEDDMLHLLPKSNNVEHISLKIEPEIEKINRWNTYYRWENYGFKYKIYQHGIDFDYRNNDYLRLLERGLNA